MEPDGTPGLVVKWLVEKFADLPGPVNFTNALIANNIPDKDEPHCQPLLERVALRNLEEIIEKDPISSDAIPLLKELVEKPSGPETRGKQRFKKELVIRVQTEVVLSVLRNDVDASEKDWALYESELERVFNDVAEDNSLLDRKRVLSALLQPKNQTKANVDAYLKNYSLYKLRADLYSLIREKRASFKTTVLDQMIHDFLATDGKPFPDVETSRRVEANGERDHDDTMNVESLREPGDSRDSGVDEVSRNSKFTSSGDHNIVSGTKRLRRKLSLGHDGNTDDGVPKEAVGGSTGTKKSRQSPPASIVNPLETSLREGVPGSGPQSSLEQEPEMCKQGPTSNGAEEPLPSSQVKRSCSPAAHQSSSMDEANVPPSTPREYIIISDDDSDAERQAPGPRLPNGEVFWECPTCLLSLKKEREAAQAKKAAAGSKKASGMGEKKKQSSTNGDELHYSRQEEAVQQSRPTIISLLSDETDTAVKSPQQQDNEEVTLRNTQGRQDSGPNQTSVIVLKNGSIQVEAGEHDSARRISLDNGVIVIASPGNVTLSIRDEFAKLSSRNEDVRVPHTPQLQEIPRRDLSSGVVKREKEPVAYSSKKLGSEERAGADGVVDREKEPFAQTGSEVVPEPAGAGAPEPGPEAGGCEEVDNRDKDGDRAKNPEDENHGSFLRPCSDRLRLPGLRRKRLPWTKQEEDTLKEGVKLFSDSGISGFQWKRILEFGHGTFDATRTDVDLKDKWRNMTKAVAVSRTNGGI